MDTHSKLSSILLFYGVCTNSNVYCYFPTAFSINLYIQVVVEILYKIAYLINEKVGLGL